VALARNFIAIYRRPMVVVEYESASSALSPRWPSDVPAALLPEVTT
jgi:hypothetical protein